MVAVILMHGAKTLSITTFSTMTVSIKGLFAIFSIITLSPTTLMLIVIMLSVAVYSLLC